MGLISPGGYCPAVREDYATNTLGILKLGILSFEIRADITRAMVFGNIQLTLAI